MKQAIIGQFFTKKREISVNVPNPDEQPEELRELVNVGNKIVLCEKSKKRTAKGPYNMLTPAKRAEVAKFAAENGNTKAARHFNLAESTVRSLKKTYLKALKTSTSTTGVTELHHGNRERPLKLGNLDNHLQVYIKKLREAGGIVTRPIVVAIARGIVQHYDPFLLLENGGHVQVGGPFAESLLRRMGFVIRKGTKAARKLPENYEEQKTNFLNRIKDKIIEHKIPAEMIINFDQTGAKLVPSSEWTMEEEGLKQVAISGLDDKREITVILGINMAGQLLPLQVIYAGKTDRCHADFKLPHDWHITHTDNHWSNEGSMGEYADRILIPYFKKIRQSLSLDASQKGLAIFDVFAVYRCESFVKKLTDAGIAIEYVPASSTGELQPLDVGVNNEFKRHMKSKFSDWYASQIKLGLDKKQKISEIEVNLGTQAVKHKQAAWLVSVINDLKKMDGLVKNAWEKAEIWDAVKHHLPLRNETATARGAARPSLFEIFQH